LAYGELIVQSGEVIGQRIVESGELRVMANPGDPGSAKGVKAALDLLSLDEKRHSRM